MKYLITLLLSTFVFAFQTNAQQDTLQIKQDTVTRFFSITEKTEIVYSGEYGTVKILPYEISTNIEGEIWIIPSEPIVFRIIEQVMFDSFEEKLRQKNELEAKVLFYETYFGKVSVDGTCTTFTPATNPPKMEKCRK